MPRASQHLAPSTNQETHFGAPQRNVLRPYNNYNGGVNIKLAMLKPKVMDGYFETLLLYSKRNTRSIIASRDNLLYNDDATECST